MAKTLSSRGEDMTNKGLLQELVFVLFDQLDIDDEPADAMDELWLQLEEGVVALAENHEAAAVAVTALTNDLITLTLNNNMLARDLLAAANLLEALTALPHHDELIDRAMAILRRDGQAAIDMVPSGGTGIDLDVNLTFNEDKLREALRLAINDYNNSISEGLLTGRLNP